MGSESMITLDEVSVRFGSAQALSRISMSFEAGITVALMGPNGSGKTTLLHVLGGITSPISGTIVMAPNTSFAYVGQHQHHHAWMPITVRETLAMSRYRSLGLLGRFERSDREHIAESAEQLGVSSLLHEQFSALSGGQRQRVLVASAVAADADVLLLDEPITGLDIPSQSRILAVLDSERDRGKLVVMSTHHLEEARRCDRVALLAHRLVAEGCPSDALTTENLALAFGEALVGVGDSGEPTVFDSHGHGDHARSAMND